MDRISAVKLWREVTNGLDVPTDRAVHMFAHLVSERETSNLREAFEALKVAHAVVISGERERCAAVFVETGRSIGRAEGIAAEREACAKWYSDKGWLLDEDDVADAMRKRDAL